MLKEWGQWLKQIWKSKGDCFDKVLVANTVAVRVGVKGCDYSISRSIEIFHLVRGQTFTVCPQRRQRFGAGQEKEKGDELSEIVHGNQRMVHFTVNGLSLVMFEDLDGIKRVQSSECKIVIVLVLVTIIDWVVNGKSRQSGLHFPGILHVLWELLNHDRLHVGFLSRRRNTGFAIKDGQTSKQQLGLVLISPLQDLFIPTRHDGDDFQQGLSGQDAGCQTGERKGTKVGTHLVEDRPSVEAFWEGEESTERVFLPVFDIFLMIGQGFEIVLVMSDLQM